MNDFAVCGAAKNSAIFLAVKYITFDIFSQKEVGLHPDAWEKFTNE